MKKPWLANLLNFFLAGAGFAYLGRWAWAVADLIGTIALAMLIHHFYPASLNVFAIASAVINGVLAHSTAVKMNDKLASPA